MSACPENEKQDNENTAGSNCLKQECCKPVFQKAGGGIHHREHPRQLRHPGKNRPPVIRRKETAQPSDGNRRAAADAHAVQQERKLLHDLQQAKDPGSQKAPGKHAGQGKSRVGKIRHGSKQTFIAVCPEIPVDQACQDQGQNDGQRTR